MLEMKQVGDKLTYDAEIELGRGGYAIVYEGLLLKGSEKVAVKRILKDHINQPLITGETKIMLRVNDHQNILRYVCYDTDDNFL